jgi:hypothetical protein
MRFTLDESVIEQEDSVETTKISEMYFMVRQLEQVVVRFLNEQEKLLPMECAEEDEFRHPLASCELPLSRTICHSLALAFW